MTTDLRTPAFGLRPPVQVDALPTDDSRVQAWVARIRDWSMNDGGTPPVRIKQAERHAPDHQRPFVLRDSA